MGAMNRAVQRLTGVGPNLAEQMRGFYLEGAYFIVPRPAPRELALFLRYENFDTQYRMPAGFEPLPAFDRDAWIFGVTLLSGPRRRRQGGLHGSSQPERRHRGAQLGQCRIGVVVLMRGRCLVGFLTAGALLLGVDAGADGERRIVRMLAERFSFTPSEIRVARGTTLELRIRSDDTMHGFRIVGRNVNLMVPKRRQGEAVVVFEATEVGRYEFECSRLCGAGHNFMRGAIVVEDAAEAR